MYRYSYCNHFTIYKVIPCLSIASTYCSSHGINYSGLGYITYITYISMLPKTPQWYCAADRWTNNTIQCSTTHPINAPVIDPSSRYNPMNNFPDDKMLKMRLRNCTDAWGWTWSVSGSQWDYHVGIHSCNVVLRVQENRAGGWLIYGEGGKTGCPLGRAAWDQSPHHKANPMLESLDKTHPCKQPSKGDGFFWILWCHRMWYRSRVGLARSDAILGGLSKAIGPLYIQNLTLSIWVDRMDSLYHTLCIYYCNSIPSQIKIPVSIATLSI